MQQTNQVSFSVVCSGLNATIDPLTCVERRNIAERLYQRIIWGSANAEKIPESEMRALAICGQCCGMNIDRIKSWFRQQMERALAAIEKDERLQDLRHNYEESVESRHRAQKNYLLRKKISKHLLNEEESDDREKECDGY